MSDEDEGGRREEETEEDYDSVFQFFSQFTKQLLLDLPSLEDRTSAAVWIQRLEMEPQTEEEKRLRTDYLKLLLFAMQRGRLMGIFKKEPPPGPLQPFPQGFGLTEMGNFLLEQAELQGSGDADGRKVSYSVEISNDLREFVAAQEIPDFGVQVYYAWSVEDPIHKWTSFDETKFPQHVRDKIRQIKMIKSEEKTNLKCGSPHGEKMDSALRKSCDSTHYEKNKAKVKSPDEIERSLERNYRSFTCYSPKKDALMPDGRLLKKLLESHVSTGNEKLEIKRAEVMIKSNSLRRERQSVGEYSQRSMRDKSLDDDKSCSPSRKSKNNSLDASGNFREIGSSKLCDQILQELDVAGTDEEDITGGMRRGSSLCRSHYVERQKSGGCQHANRKREADTSKRLQKCDDRADNGLVQMNEPSRMAGPSQRIADRSHGREMYSESGRCNREAVLSQKPPCPSGRGYQMNQANSQPSMKTRKNKCSGQVSQIQQEDIIKKCVCSTTIKGSSHCSQPKSQCSCPCPRTEKEISQRENTCFKKNEKSQLEKSCPKAKPPCPESAAGRKPQVQPCIVVEEATQSCPKKVHSEHPEGCTCYEEKRKQQIENLSKIGKEKTSEQCPQMPAQQQQYSCSKRKTNGREEKITPEQLEESALDPCSKNPSRYYEDQVKKRLDVFQESCCQQGKKLQDYRSHGQPCPGDYPADGYATCPKNQDPENGMYVRPGRDGPYVDKRCEAEVKEPKYSQKLNQECPGNNPQPCSGKRIFPNETYTIIQEPAPRQYKYAPRICVCGGGGQILNREQELGDNASSGSDENPGEERDGPDDACADPNYNPDEEGLIDCNAYEDGNAECSSSSENIPCQNFNHYGLNEPQKKCLAPQGSGPCPGAEKQFLHVPGQAPTTSQCSKQKYSDQKSSPQSKRKIVQETRYFSSLQSPRIQTNFVTSTPTNDNPPQPFSCVSASPVPHYHRTRCNKGQSEEEDELVPINMLNPADIHSCYKENGSGRKKKTFQDLQGGRGSPGQPHFMTLMDENMGDNPEMMQTTQCSPVNLTEGNILYYKQKRLDSHMMGQACHRRTL